MFKKILAHYRNNPDGYWFKRSIFGWGWVPVKWQGWIVFLASVASVAFGIYVGETDDAPGAALLGVIIGAALTLGFGRWKGEKACWTWGFPKDEKTQ